jgi:hypothetical protein
LIFIRWSFYINLPLGAITLIISIFLLHIPRPKGSLLQKLKRIDYVGTVVVVGSTIALLLPLNWGGSEYPWNSPIIIVLLIVGFVGYIIFGFVESKFAIEPIAPRKFVDSFNQENLCINKLIYNIYYYSSLI